MAASNDLDGNLALPMRVPFFPIDHCSGKPYLAAVGAHLDFMGIAISLPQPLLLTILSGPCQIAPPALMPALYGTGPLDNVLTTIPTRLPPSRAKAGPARPSKPHVQRINPSGRPKPVRPPSPFPPHVQAG